MTERDTEGARPRGGGRRRADGLRQPQETPDQGRPLPYRVARWGKFWSLEPLFADARSYLVAKGGAPPKLDDLVLAVPSHGDRRRIVEVLGGADDLGAVLRALLHAKGVRQGFSAAVLDEAAAVKGRAARPDHGRRDLTALPTFTIDPDTARDFDDAISVAREGTGYRAHVHIADVSYFVDDDGEIEREARRRTSSLYLPLFAEPMLPAALSSDLCSLVPRQPRKCLTVEFTFDAQGRRTATQYYRSLISSDHRLTYGFADTVIGPAAVELAGGEDAAGAEAAAVPLADPKAAVAALPGAHLVAGRPEPPRDVPDATMEADAELRAELLLAAELAGVLRRRRLARGALTIGSFEPEYAFDHAGALSGAAARPETPSHALVEEFMLAANEAVAEYLLRKKAHTLYRVHEPPEAASTRELLDQLEELGVPTPPFPAGEAVPAAQLAEFYGRLSRLVLQTSVRERRGRLSWSTLILRSLKQARYAPGNLGHFGLASPAYLHFTSPIRRYPDLVTHRALLYHLGEGGSELGEAELATAADDCSTRERDVLAAPSSSATTSPSASCSPGAWTPRAGSRRSRGRSSAWSAAGSSCASATCSRASSRRAASGASASRSASTRRRSSARRPARATASATRSTSRSSASTASAARSTWRRPSRTADGRGPGPAASRRGGPRARARRAAIPPAARPAGSAEAPGTRRRAPGRRPEMVVRSVTHVRTYRLEAHRTFAGAPGLRDGTDHASPQDRTEGRCATPAPGAPGRACPSRWGTLVGMPRETGIKRVAENRKARHDYFIDDTFEAGIALVGTEVKSLREGRVNLRDSYVEVRGSAHAPELFLVGAHISPYDQGNIWNHDPLRARKLLMHRHEIERLAGKVREKGYSVVPTKLYFRDGRAKIEIGLGRGKKLYDKRHDMADRDAKRDMQRALRGRGEDRR